VWVGLEAAEVPPSPKAHAHCAMNPVPTAEWSVKLMGEPRQIKLLALKLAMGFGFTVMVKGTSGPVQLFRLACTKTVEATETVVVLMVVKTDRLPVPEVVPIPMAGLVAVQKKVGTPVLGVAEKTTRLVVTLGQYSTLGGWVTSGVGLICTV
jgi:hypothetical protein